MSASAVFLSYSPQDAPAAQRLAGWLRVAGIEVWLDQSELRGGDAWDATIRRQIKACTLFVPIISSNTDTRGEGYFRLEWRLGVERAQSMADDHPFLLPVVVDDTPDATARVRDAFRERQWSRLKGGDATSLLMRAAAAGTRPGHDKHRSIARAAIVIAAIAAMTIVSTCGQQYRDEKSTKAAPATTQVPKTNHPDTQS